MQRPGAPWPRSPIDVFRVDAVLLLADGHHRLLAAQKAGRDELTARVYPGTRSDCVRFALKSNSTHGLRRSNADKRRCVELALAEWADISDREIARVAGVSHPFVSEVRRQLETVSTSSAASAKRLGRDGKRRRSRVAQKPCPCPNGPEILPSIPTAQDSMDALRAKLPKEDRAAVEIMPRGTDLQAVCLANRKQREFEARVTSAWGKLLSQFPSIHHSKVHQLVAQIIVRTFSPSP